MRLFSHYCRFRLRLGSPGLARHTDGKRGRGVKRGELGGSQKDHGRSKIQIE